MFWSICFILYVFPFFLFNSVLLIFGHYSFNSLYNYFTFIYLGCVYLYNYQKNFLFVFIALILINYTGLFPNAATLTLFLSQLDCIVTTIQLVRAQIPHFAICIEICSTCSSSLQVLWHFPSCINSLYNLFVRIATNYVLNYINSHFELSYFRSHSPIVRISFGLSS